MQSFIIMRPGCHHTSNITTPFPTYHVTKKIKAPHIASYWCEIHGTVHTVNENTTPFQTPQRSLNSKDWLNSNPCFRNSVNWPLNWQKGCILNIWWHIATWYSYWTSIVCRCRSVTWATDMATDQIKSILPRFQEIQSGMKRYWALICSLS